MTQHPGTFQGVTVAEAATALGVSTTTVRRMIRRGQLEAQTVIRPQGRAFLVNLSHAKSDAAGGDHDTRQDARATSRTDAAVPSESRGMAAWSEAFLLPLVATLERQAMLIGQLERENGRLTERLALMAPETPPAGHQTAPMSETTPEPSHALSRAARWPVLVVVAVAVLAASILLLTPR